MKTVIDYIQNYQKKWKKHEQNKYRKNPKKNFKLSTKRIKTNWMSNEEMGKNVRLQQATWPNT
jgi:hypothetical protein